MKIRIAGIVDDSIVDGEGVRLAIVLRDKARPSPCVLRRNKMDRTALEIRKRPAWNTEDNFA